MLTCLCHMYYSWTHLIGNVDLTMNDVLRKLRVTRNP